MWVEILFLSLNPASAAASFSFPFPGSFWSVFLCFCFLSAHLNRKFPKESVWPVSSNCFLQRFPPGAFLYLQKQGVSPHFWSCTGRQPPYQSLLWQRASGCIGQHETGAITVVWAVIPIWDEVAWWHLSEHQLCGSEHELWGMHPSTLYDSAFAFLAH